MRIAFLILVIIHALIHVLGFLKAFDIAEIKELTLPIPKSQGMIWLLATILFLAYAILYIMQSKYSWAAGIFAIIISQFIVFCFWKDARLATIPNLLILVVVLISYGNFRINELIKNETYNILNQPGASKPTLLYPAEISELPASVQKWLEKSGALGREKMYAGRIEQKMLMKMKPDQKTWYPAKALQYTNIENPAFIWSVDVEMNSLMKVKGRDKFFNGKGEMLIKLNALINAVDAKGDKLDEGTMQRYIGEMVWFPSMATSPYITWQQLDEYSAKATMNYNGTSGDGTFFFNEEGDFVKFTAMRFKDNKPDAKRYEWVMTVDDYKIFDGVKVPARMKATWKLEEGEWTWLNLEIIDLTYNEAVR